MAPSRVPEGSRSGGEVDPQLVPEDLDLAVQPGNQGRHLVVAGGLQHRLSRGVPVEAEEGLGRPVGEPDPAAGVDDDQALHHAVEEGRGPERLLL